MDNLDEWIDRLQNELDLNRELQTDLITMRFTRRDVIELKLIISTLAFIKEQNNG